MTIAVLTTKTSDVENKLPATSSLVTTNLLKKINGVAKNKIANPCNPSVALNCQ